MQKIRPCRSQLSEVGESGGFGIRDAREDAKLVLTALKKTERSERNKSWR